MPDSRNVMFLLLSENRSYQWRWLASTLNPYYEGNSLQDMIEYDRFITQTSDHWCFGADNTGDIFSSDFIESLVGECTKKELNSVHLVCISVIFNLYSNTLLMFIGLYDSLLCLAMGALTLTSSVEIRLKIIHDHLLEM